MVWVTVRLLNASKPWQLVHRARRKLLFFINFHFQWEDGWIEGTPPLAVDRGTPLHPIPAKEIMKEESKGGFLHTDFRVCKTFLSSKRPSSSMID